MTIRDADVIRSMLVGQMVWTFLWIVIIVVLLLRLSLRPGAAIGLVCLVAGHYLSLMGLFIYQVERFGQPPTYRIWLVFSAVLISGLGYVLVATHLFFHDKMIMKRVINWFRDLTKGD